MQGVIFMLRIHFLNVGHGDCTLIEFPSGRKTLVDINNSRVIDEETKNELASNSATYHLYESLGYSGIQLLEKSVVDFVPPVDAVDYINDKLTGKSIFRFILTHPDMDHMTGLYKLKDEGVCIYNFWDTSNTKEVKESEVPSKYDFRDWETYQEHRKSLETPKVLHILKGEQRDFFNEDGIKVLSPTQEIINEANSKKCWNLLSYILLIEYAGHKIILGGDADAEIWDKLAEEDEELLTNISILKAAHHGRNSGYSQKATSIMKPIWTICSVGKKPSQDAHNKYKQYTEKKVLSTRFRGTIVAEISDTGILTMYCEDNYNSDEDLHPLNTYQRI
jgi:competence protein ComEC